MSQKTESTALEQSKRQDETVLADRERVDFERLQQSLCASIKLAASPRSTKSIHIKVRSKNYDVLKRCLDIGITLAAIPLFLPVACLCALAIWMEDGRPIFFLQPRTGKGGKVFLMYKFRTMVTNAEEIKEKYAHLNQLQWPDFKIANDPRITRVGRILRKTSMDELPQLLNVLRGDMSLVGPRPTSFDVSTYELWHTERLEVVPGITGLWQVSGRSNVDFDERLRLDVQYIEQRSIRFDLWILCKTVLAVILPRGAY